MRPYNLHYLFNKLEIFSLLLLLNSSYAQEANSSSTNRLVKYHSIFNFRYDNGENFSSFEARLYLQDSVSFFFMIPVGQPGENLNERELQFGSDTLFKTIKKYRERLIVFDDLVFMKKYTLYNDTLYPMKWNITQEKKLMDTLECFKATAKFKGRTYIAWFCPSIAIPEGPWKLGGLPGLIVEASDTDGNLKFRLAEIRNLPQGFKYPILNATLSYPDFIRNGRAFVQRLRDSYAAADHGGNDCLSCETRSTVTVYTWEKLF